MNINFYSFLRPNASHSAMAYIYEHSYKVPRVYHTVIENAAKTEINPFLSRLMNAYGY